MDEWIETEIPDGFGCLQPAVRIKRLTGSTLCIECGQPFTDDNPGTGNVGYLKHGNGCPDYIQRSTSIINDEVE